MRRRTARVILAIVAGLWIATVYALSVGAVQPGFQATSQTTCQTVDPGLPLPCPKPTPSPSGSRSPTPRPSPSGSPTPSPSPSPSRSASPTPMQSPPGSSPSPTQSTPPPPSVREYSSNISIAYKQGAFKGRVRSQSARCETGRRVTLKKVKPGSDATVGKGRTDGDGRWRIPKRDPEGRYYAKVKRRQFDGGGNRTIVCKAARSRTIRP